jgi:hypothetical protein
MAGRIAKLGKVKTTGRGFEIITFKDRYDCDCSLQQSSLAEYELPGSSAVWLGTDKDRMHLDRKQVKALIEVLSLWLETGSFDKPKEREREK